MRLFYRSLLSELAITGLAVFVALMALVLTVQAVRLLSLAAAGGLAVDAVVTMMAFGALRFVPPILGVTVFITVLSTLNRAFRDSEMAVWMSSGLSLAAWIRPILAFSGPAALLCFALTLFIAPWAEQKMLVYQRLLEAQEVTQALTPGVFRETHEGQEVMYVADFDLKKALASGVFLRVQRDGVDSLILAESGQQMRNAAGEFLLVLRNGQRYDGINGGLDWRVAQFAEYALRIQPKIINEEGVVPLRAKDSLSLAHSNNLEEAGEWHWRLSLPVSLLLLSVLAIPLSVFNPRGGKSVHLIYAMLIYMIYNNAMSIGESLIEKGQLSPALGLWPLHGMVLLCTLYLFAKRQGYRWPWQRRSR